MRKSMNKVYLSFISSIALTFLYIYTYTNNLTAIWIVFAIDRVLSIFYTNKVDKILDNINFEEDLHKSNENHNVIVSRFMISLLILVIVCLIMIGYIVFNYIELFALLIIGEIIDRLVLNIKEIIDEKKQTKKN